MLGKLFGIALCVALSACSGDATAPADKSPTLVIHAVLDPGSSDQLVLVERVHDGTLITGSSFLAQAVPVLGASVAITTPDGRDLTATEDRFDDTTDGIYGQYRVSLSRYGVTLAPGGIYRLRVTTTIGEVVTGVTTIPRAKAVAPSAVEGFDRAHDVLRMLWSPVVGARSYEVRVTSKYRPYILFADTSAVIDGEARNIDNDPIFAPGVLAAVSVSAIDENYYDYYRTGTDPFTGAPASRLVGGAGLFGSIVPLTLRRLQVR